MERYFFGFGLCTRPRLLLHPSCENVQHDTPCALTRHSCSCWCMTNGLISSLKSGWEGWVGGRVCVWGGGHSYATPYSQGPRAGNNCTIHGSYPLWWWLSRLTFAVDVIYLCKTTAELNAQDKHASRRKKKTSGCASTHTPSRGA